jgi:predicted nucleic acid-binding protein
LFAQERALAVPDVLVLEVLAVFRRHVQRGSIAPERATHAIDDLGDLAIEIFPSLPLRERAWELRDNLTAADALFVALAERLGEPLATKDRRLAAAAREHAGIATIELVDSS